MRLSKHGSLLLFALLHLWESTALLPGSRVSKTPCRRVLTRFASDREQQPEDSSEEDSSTSLENGIDTSLLPPPINLSRGSILFGENPETKQNNASLNAWRAAKAYLPFVLTGARTPTTADDMPIAGFYNMIFVRLPTIVTGVLYSKNALSGHPLVIDVGGGPTEVSPLIVAVVLFVILR
jgi:hypothetical protein